LNRGHRRRHRWCRRCRLNNGRQVCGPAAASPKEITYSE
jgi:hypothetical protein